MTGRTVGFIALLGAQHCPSCKSLTRLSNEDSAKEGRWNCDQYKSDLPPGWIEVICRHEDATKPETRIDHADNNACLDTAFRSQECCYDATRHEHNHGLSEDECEMNTGCREVPHVHGVGAWDC